MLNQPVQKVNSLKQDLESFPACPRLRADCQPPTPGKQAPRPSLGPQDKPPGPWEPWPGQQHTCKQDGRSDKAGGLCNLREGGALQGTPGQEFPPRIGGTAQSIPTTASRGSPSSCGAGWGGKAPQDPRRWRFWVGWAGRHHLKKIFGSLSPGDGAGGWQGVGRRRWGRAFQCLCSSPFCVF